jgi:predicted amidohydrolase YtcJ
VALVCPQNASNVVADKLVTHGKVYTLDAKQPWAQAVAIRSGKIIAVGSEEELGRMRGIGTKVIDAGGRLVHYCRGTSGLSDGRKIVL